MIILVCSWLRRVGNASQGVSIYFIFFLAFRSFLEFCNFTVWNEGQDPSVAESRIDFIFLEISVKLGECGEIFSLVGSDLP